MKTVGHFRSIYHTRNISILSNSSSKITIKKAINSKSSKKRNYKTQKSCRLARNFHQRVVELENLLMLNHQKEVYLELIDLYRV